MQMTLANILTSPTETHLLPPPDAAQPIQRAQPEITVEAVERLNFLARSTFLRWRFLWRWWDAAAHRPCQGLGKGDLLYSSRVQKVINTIQPFYVGSYLKTSCGSISRGGAARWCARCSGGPWTIELCSYFAIKVSVSPDGQTGLAISRCPTEHVFSICCLVSARIQKHVK